MYPAQVKIAEGKEKLVDSRLLGIWISDKEKTVKYLRFKEDSTPEKRAKLADLFGKLKIEFTKDEMRTEFEGNIETGPYTVIAMDSDSVVVLGKDLQGPKIIQVHFEKDGYYVVSGYMVEFFKRFQPNPPFNSDAASSGGPPLPPP